jgi:hypothetical protein
MPVEIAIVRTLCSSESTVLSRVSQQPPAKRVAWIFGRRPHRHPPARRAERLFNEKPGARQCSQVELDAGCRATGAGKKKQKHCCASMLNLHRVHSTRFKQEWKFVLIGPEALSPNTARLVAVEFAAGCTAPG